MGHSGLGEVVQPQHAEAVLKQLDVEPAQVGEVEPVVGGVKLKFGETEMAYLTAGQIGTLLADFGSRELDAGARPKNYCHVRWGAG